MLPRSPPQWSAIWGAQHGRRQSTPRTTSRPLRAWQQAALEQYEQQSPKDFLVTATPGAGKTTFALTLAARLLQRREVARVIVVCPTDHLRLQWADAADATRASCSTPD